MLLGPLTLPERAVALTGDDVVDRARSWVERDVPYSQSRSFEGYRTDCSGFVSMAWGLDQSYTTRTIGSVAITVPLSELKRGDAILTPGHIVIFAGWADTGHTTFLSLEEANGRLGTVSRIKALPSNGRGLRFGGLTAPVPIVAPTQDPPRMTAEEAAAARKAADVIENAERMVASIADARPSYTVQQTVEVAQVGV